MSISLQRASIFCFDDYQLKRTSRTLERRGRPVPLGSKAFEVLTCLVVHAGDVVTKTELLEWVWPESHVEEGTLSQHIFALRKAFGENAGYIVTVPGRGYQFTAAVQELPAEAASPARTGGDEIRLQQMRERTHIVIEETTSTPTPAAHRVSTFAKGAVAGTSVAAAAALLLAAWGAWQWVHRPQSPDFQKVAVADILNSTGDATFDTALKRALQIDLEQSPYMDVLSEHEATATLQLMGRTSETPLRGDTAREVCERANRQVLLTGSIAAVGKEYLLTLEAVDCASGKELGAAKARATSKEDVFSALDTVTDRVRGQLGESLKSVQSYQVPITEATTPSFEALKAYSIGTMMEAQGKQEQDVLPLFQQAIALDPKFAMAYGEIGTQYYNLSEFQLATEFYKKAFDLRSHVSARENLVLSAHYYAEGQQDLEQGIRVYQLWAATYPHDWAPLLNLANEYTQIGNYGPAIDAGQRALALEPARPVTYSVLARAYHCAGRFEEAKALGQLAMQRGKDGNGLHGTLFVIAWQQHDDAALARETQWADGPGGWYGRYLEAYMAAEQGRAARANELFRDAIALARQAHLDESADEMVLDHAAIQIEFGMPDAGRVTLKQVVSADTDPVYLLTLRALLGETAPAEAYLATHGGVAGNRTKPPGTLTTYLKLPRLRASLDLTQDKPNEALRALEPAAPYELEAYEVLSLHGNAALQAHRPELAAAQFQRLLANQGIGYGPLYPMAHLGLARAYAALGRTSDSRTEYQSFLSAWKDADPDLPLLKTAQAELARLR
jgi:DNA-binding winged helix-turn-helix (wHTH) protein/tetratricopeptide (TPR) repeat protein